MKISVRRILMSLFGVLIGGMAVSVFKIAAMGVDPFQSFMSGLNKVIPIDFGTLYMITNAVLLLFSLIFNRHCIGVATFINLFLLGYVTQFCYDFLLGMLGTPSLAVRVICLIIGIVVICISGSLYMTADLGVSTYDAIAITMAYKWKIGKFKYIRIATDVTCVLVGVGLFLLGGGKWNEVFSFAGIATIITAFFMGPLVEYFNQHIAQPMLENEKLITFKKKA